MSEVVTPGSVSAEDFAYELPPERVALRPVTPRDASRLLVLDRRTGDRSHTVFRELTAWLRPGDLLVLNDTRVVPARLRGQRPGGGNVEVLLVAPEGREDGDEIWTCLARPARRLRPGTTVSLAGGIAGTWLDGGTDDGQRRIRLQARRPIPEILEEVGEVPLPPYIARRLEEADRNRYQTVYADRPGSVAAPTAGLHFTPALLERIGSLGVEIHRLTLHVGPGTFLPLRSESVDEHRMLPEQVEIPAAVADAVNRAPGERRRVIAVGTTTVRALEGASREGRLEAFQGPVSLFIRPGYRFGHVDALITNFHLPRSTLLVLVATFAGRNRVLTAYREAVERGYRFYSYGDAMLIV